MRIKLALVAILLAGLLTGCTGVSVPVAPPPGPVPTAAQLPAVPTPTPYVPFTGSNPADYVIPYSHTTGLVALDLPGDWSIVETSTDPDTLVTFSVPFDPVPGVGIVLQPASGSAEQAARDYATNVLGLNLTTLTHNHAFSYIDGEVGWQVAGLTDDGLIAAAFVRRAGEQTLVLYLRAANTNALTELERLASTLTTPPATPLAFDRNNALVLASGEPLTIDPALTRSGGAGIIGDLFAGLVVLDPDMQVRPALADSISVDASGTVYTFTLRPDVTFHNGRPITASDVEYSWLRAAHPDTGSETVLLYLGDVRGLRDYRLGRADSITGLTVLDDRTLQVTLDAPRPYFLAKLTYPVSWVVDRYQVERPNWELAPNGSGPFRVIQHLEDQIWLLGRHAQSATPPHLDYLVYTLYTGNPRRLYESGDIDLTGIPPELIDRASDPSDPLYGTVVTETNYCTSYITFNTRLAPFDSPLVRQAFVHAIDRARYIEAITNNRSQIAHGLLPPGIPGYNLNRTGPPYDPERARQLLRHAGYSNPGLVPPITWTIASNSGLHSGAVAFLVDSWRDALGVTVLVEGIDPDSYYDRLEAGQFGHLLFEGWCADYPDPENFLDVLYHSASALNRGGYASTEYDVLVEDARTETDPARRLALYDLAEQLLINDAPALFLSHAGPTTLVWKPYVTGYRPAPIGVPQHPDLRIER